MKRRDFLKIPPLLAAGSVSSEVFAESNSYNGKLLIQLYARGGWDTTSFCDPKINAEAKKTVNNWSDEFPTMQAGNLNYAPYARNQYFFEKYFKHMLVINGIDVETSSHELGAQYSLSGSKDTGFPSLTALFSAIKAPHLPLSYISFSDYKETASLVNYSRLNNLDDTLEILDPNSALSKSFEKYHSPSALSLIKQTQTANISALKAKGSSKAQNLSYERYLHSLDSSTQLKEFSSFVLEEIHQGNIDPEYRFDITGDLRSQIQIGLLALASGVCCSLDLMKPNFDTHSDHDRRHVERLTELVNDIDYFWTYAEKLGISERIILVVNSEIARTPWYNEQAGKDHWPITSTLVMEKGARWGNKVIGATDSNLQALKISKHNLMVSEAEDAITLHPRDIHNSLRQYLGLSQHPFAQKFEFNDAHALNFFA